MRHNEGDHIWGQSWHAGVQHQLVGLDHLGRQETASHC